MGYVAFVVVLNKDVGVFDNVAQGQIKCSNINIFKRSSSTQTPKVRLQTN